MDHPRGGKRLRFDEPLTAYPPARQRRLQPPIPLQSLPSISPTCPTSSAATQQPISRLPTSSERVPLPPNQFSHPTTIDRLPTLSAEARSLAGRVLLPAIQPALSDPIPPSQSHPPTRPIPPLTRPIPPTRPNPQPIAPTRPTAARPTRPTRPPVPDQSEVVPTQLIENHRRRQAATDRFPPNMTHACVRDSHSRYEDHISSVIKSIETICGSCGRFIEGQVFRLPEVDPRLQPFRVDSDSSLRLDSCAKDGSDFLFCSPCHTAISQNRPPKYSALNGINVTFCQSYPDILQELTLVEECLVARCHPIASIVKLRPQGATYDGLRGHVVVLPQEPGPLLDILPSAELNLVDKIKVIWFGDGTPSAEDLKPYLEVRKHVVLRALRWLRLHNILYSHVTVNEALLSSWEESFIPRDLEDSIVRSENDHDEREGYAANLRAGNYENDFQEALDGQTSAPISTGCVYTDVESSRQHPTLQLVSAILNLEKDRFEREAGPRSSGEESGPHYMDDVPVIRYVSRGRTVLMNDWQDPEFFTGSFPTLFPLGSGGHLPLPQERPVPVSLQAWAGWALSHHSRR